MSFAHLLSVGAACAVLVATPASGRAPPGPRSVLVRGSADAPVSAWLLARVRGEQRLVELSAGHRPGHFVVEQPPTRGTRPVVVASESHCGFAPLVGGTEPEPVVVELRPRGALLGEVRDAEGRLVARASVRLSPVADDPVALSALRRLGDGGVAERLREELGPAEVETDADGGFVADGLCALTWELDVRPRAALPPPRVRVAVAPDRPDRDATGRPLPAWASVVLPAGWTLGGRVLEQVGDARLPVAGASVRVGSRPALSDSEVAVSVTTDRGGHLRVDGLPLGAPVGLRVTAPGYSSVTRTCTSADVPLEVVLERLGRIELHLVAAGGEEPVTSAVVRLVRGGAGGRRRAAAAAALTAEDGRHVLRDVPPGDVSAWIEADGFLPRYLESFEVPAGGVASLGDVVLRRGRSVRGVVVDDETEEPVAGATVAVGPPGHRATRSGSPTPGGVAAATDAEGRFELRGLADGEWRLVASHPGHARTVEHELRVSLDDAWDDQADEVRFRLKRSGELLVRLVDRAGEPVPGVLLQARSASGRWLGPVFPTDADGSAVLSGVPPGRVEVFRAGRGAARGSAGRVTVPAGGQAELVIVVRGATIRGRILADGVPVPGRVDLRAAWLGREPFDWRRLSPSYELRDVPIGDHRLVVDVPLVDSEGSYLERRFARVFREVRVPPDQAEVVRDLHVELRVHDEEAAAKPCRVVGRLTAQGTGEGLAGHLVEATGGTGAPVALTREGGRFEIELPGGGVWCVQSRRDDELTWLPGPEACVVVEDGAVTSGSVPLEVTSRRAQFARLRVVQDLPGGLLPLPGTGCRPLAGAFVEGARVRSWLSAPATADASGRVALDWSPEGVDDVLCVVPDRGILFVPDVTVLDAGRERVVVLGPTGALQLSGDWRSARLVEPVTGHGWELPVSEPPLRGLLQPGDDRLVVHGLPPGRWGVASGDERLTVSVEAGGLATLALDE